MKRGDACGAGGGRSSRLSLGQLDHTGRSPKVQPKATAFAR
jgi:hypothetical protein